jgi:hypothetical protein
VLGKQLDGFAAVFCEQKRAGLRQKALFNQLGVKPRIVGYQDLEFVASHQTPESLLASESIGTLRGDV